VLASTISRLLGRRRHPETATLDLAPLAAGDAEPAGDEAGIARIGDGVADFGYAGAMLFHGFLERAGAAEVLAGVASSRARRYDTSSMLLAATFGFALGASFAEVLVYRILGRAGVGAG